MSRTLEIKPIRTEADYERALKQAEQLWDAKAGSVEEDVLDVLATLIDAYEGKHFPMDVPDPVEAILFRMEQQGLGRRDLEPMIGGRGRVSEVLEHKRPLSITMIRNLYRHWGIPAEVLIQAQAEPKKKRLVRKKTPKRVQLRATSARSTKTKTSTPASR